MTDKFRFRLTHATARKMAKTAVMSAPDGWLVTLTAPKRSEDQSALMHGMADDLSKQLPYMGMTLTREQWKRFATAKLKKDTIVFDCDEHGQPDPKAGLLVLGATTRDSSAKEVGEIIDWFEWMGAQHNVVWTHETKKVAQLADARR